VKTLQVRVLRFTLVGAAWLCFGFALNLVWTCARGKVSFESCDSAYCVTVRERRCLLASFCANEAHDVWITRRGNPDYGYVVTHSFVDDVRTVRVEWQAAGVTLLEPSGQTTFVPSKLYTGGR